MSLLYHPEVGTIVRVDLNEGFRVPEMRKRRPCIIISPPIANRAQLCTIVPLSTSVPRPPQAHHCQIEFDPPLPFPYASPVMWVKADMVMTVAFHRLKLLHLQGRGEDGARQYDIRVIGEAKLNEVRRCVASAIGM